MTAPDYIINPILMGGLVKEVSGDLVKVHLHGRLGVITVPRKLIIEDDTVEPGTELKFYFSYVQVVQDSLDYDLAAMNPALEITPALLGGTISEVNDTAVKVTLMKDQVTVAVPRRWVFTDTALKEGLACEFYFSCMHITGKREIPQESI